MLLQQQQQMQGVLMLWRLGRQRRLRRLVKGLLVAAGQVGGGRALGPQRGGGSGCGSAGQQNRTPPGTWTYSAIGSSRSSSRGGMAVGADLLLLLVRRGAAVAPSTFSSLGLC
jgi:hypothetical protein